MEAAALKVQAAPPNKALQLTGASLVAARASQRRRPRSW